MQQLKKTILKFIIHTLPSLQTGEYNQNPPNDRLMEPDISLIEGYLDSEVFYLDKLVEDSKEDSEFPSRIYQSYKNFTSNNQGVDIPLKIIKSFRKSDNITQISSTEVYKYLLKIVISGIYDEIKSGRDRYHDEYFNENLMTFKECFEDRRIILKREFFEGEETKKLNFEKFLIVIDFDYGFITQTYLGDYLFDVLKIENFYRLIKCIGNNNIKENLEDRFYILLGSYGEKRLFLTYFSIVKFILEYNESNTDLGSFELKFYNRIVDILNMTNENLLEGLAIKKEFEEITQKFLDKTQVFNLKEEETIFSTEMFCILRYLDIYGALYKYDGEIYNDKDNFLMKRIRKSEDYIINLPSEILYTEASEAGEFISVMKKILFNYRYRDITYIKKMNLEKVLEIKTNFCLNFISLHYSSVTDSDKEIFEDEFQLILSEETNPEELNRKMGMGLIRIKSEIRR